MPTSNKREGWLLFLALLASALVCALAVVGSVVGGDGVGQPATGNKVAGAFAGAVLAALVLYALFVAARPVIEARDHGLKRALLVLLALWIVKTVVVAFAPGYSIDVGTYEAWALQIAVGGPVSMYHAGYFLDYPPGYLYALWAAGSLANAIGVSSSAPLLIIVETPALAADFALAALMYVFVRRSGSERCAWIAMLFVALNPALLLDTVGWGQADSALTLVLLLSAVMMLEDETALAWSLAALALLIKPQTMMLLPVLALWTLRKGDFGKWWRAALTFGAIVIVGAAPFQVAHSWNWLPALYFSTAAFYHETSVNAFNLMALLGGLRRNDAGTVIGISYFALGVTLLIPLYVSAGVTLWRYPTRRNFIFASFITLFGFFMFASRMHERYLYPAVVFAIPLAVQEAALLAVFLLVTATGCFNLAYVLHALNTVVFLDPRDRLAMATSAINLLAFALAAGYGYAHATVAVAENQVGQALDAKWVGRFLSGWRARTTLTPAPAQTLAPLPWRRLDSAIIVALIAAAAVLRFWHIGHPPEIVFDEVHFVGQARHYLRGEPFLDPHPPVAKLIIALGILLFGDHPWSWRLGNASLGTVMVGVTYMLGRRMFGSRLAAALAAAFVACDGFFIVDSRIGCIDIVYLTFAAIAYLLLFRLIETRDLIDRRLMLIAIGVALGLCLGSKLYVPAITFLLVTGFVFYSLWREQRDTYRDEPGDGFFARTRVAAGAMLMLGSVSMIFYLAAFLPHYLLGWWGGIENLFHYYSDVVSYEKSVATATHPYASRWWSWPLMLRPVAYWQNFPQKGDVATIWGAGNPLTWWAVIPAMTITAVRALERPSVARAFIVVGFLAYYVIWIPIGRVLFLYHYMPSLYLGYLALGAVLADCWNGEAETWENLAMILTVAPVLIIGLGHSAVTLKPALISDKLWPLAGFPLVAALGAVYLFLIKRPQRENRFVFVVFMATAVILFAYYLPVWLGTPIARSGYYARMWLEGPGLRNWI